MHLVHFCPGPELLWPVPAMCAEFASESFHYRNASIPVTCKYTFTCRCAHSLKVGNLVGICVSRSVWCAVLFPCSRCGIEETCAGTW